MWYVGLQVASGDLTNKQGGQWNVVRWFTGCQRRPNQKTKVDNGTWHVGLQVASYDLTNRLACTDTRHTLNRDSLVYRWPMATLTNSWHPCQTWFLGGSTATHHTLPAW